jgi:hypothetical protein
MSAASGTVRRILPAAPPCAGRAIGFNFGFAMKCNLRDGLSSRSSCSAAEEAGFRVFAPICRRAMVRKGTLAGDEPLALSGGSDEY